MSDIDTLMERVAIGLVVRHKLRNEYGEIVCWNCRERPATMPTLHCRPCLALGPEGRRLGEKMRAPRIAPALPLEGDESEIRFP